MITKKIAILNQAALSFCFVVAMNGCSTHAVVDEPKTPEAERLSLQRASELDQIARAGKSRAPASAPKLPGKSGGEILEDIVYENVPVLKYIPLVWPFADSLALEKIKGYVEELPANEAVKKAVIARIDNPSFEDDVIPFVVMLKDHYVTPDEEFTPRTFRKWLEGQGDKYPGFSLDAYAKEEKAKPETKKEEKKESSGMDPRVAASILEIYYELFVSKNYDMEKPYHEDREIVAKVVTKVGDLMDILGKSYQGTEGDLSNMIRSIQKDPVKKEAIAITIVKFIHQQKYRHYRMFRQVVRRHETLKKFYGKSLEKVLNQSDSSAAQKLIDQLNYAQNGRRYAMQIVVDGLQGSLVRALTRPMDPESQKFLKQVRADYEFARTFDIPGEESTSMGADKQKLTFLPFLQETGAQGKKPRGFMEYFANTVLNPAQGSAIAHNGISTTPTISVRNIPVALSGAPMSEDGGIGLPNFHFVDRTGKIERKFEKAGMTYPKNPPMADRAYYFYGNDALLQEDMTKVNGMKTMFERLENNFDTFNCAAPHDRGSNWAYDTVINLLGGEKKRELVDIACLRELSSRAENEAKARKLRPEVIQLIKNIRDRNEKLKNWAVVKFFEDTVSDLVGDRAILVEKMEELIKYESRGMPQFVQYYNPFPDHFAHFTGPFSDEIISKSGEYNRLSFLLSQFDFAFKHAGVKDRTLFGMAGDHGLGSVERYLNPEDAVFKRLKDDPKAWGEVMGSDKPFEIKVRKISSDEGEGPKIANAWRPNAKLSAPVDPKKPDGEWAATEDNSNRGKDVIVASTAGGNFMMDFFKDHANAKLWAEQPVYEELRRLKLQSGQTLDVIKALTGLLPNSLEYLVVRDRVEGLPKDVRVTRIVAPRKGKIYHAQIFTRVERVKGSKLLRRRHFYKILPDAETGEKVDVLGLTEPNPYQLPPEGQDALYIEQKLAQCQRPEVENTPEKWCPDSAWQSATQHLERKDAVNQLAQLYDSDLPGTVNLFPKKFVGYNTKVSGRHAGETFHEKDSFLGFWGEPIKGHSKVIPSGVIGSLPPTIYHYLTGKSAGEVDGFDYPSLLNLFIE